LKRAGRLWTGCCPFHVETTPSFTVYRDHYHCYGCDAHGDAIDFVRRIDGTDFAGAVARLAAEAGLDAPRGNRQAQRERDAQIEAKRAEREAKQATKETSDHAHYVRWARRQIRQTVPIAGTLAERYLTETRGIPCPSDGWPDAVRFDVRAGALVVVATDADGATQAGQQIHLTPEATKAPETEDRPTKNTLGPVKGAAVRLPGRTGAPLLIAEGPETGLSLWASTGCETWIGLGSIGNVLTPPLGREVVA
jgi:putative DNA primase/helicase